MNKKEDTYKQKSKKHKNEKESNKNRKLGAIQPDRQKTCQKKCIMKHGVAL
jgi:hypothetical protein